MYIEIISKNRLLVLPTSQNLYISRPDKYLKLFQYVKYFLGYMVLGYFDVQLWQKCCSMYEMGVFIYMYLICNIYIYIRVAAIIVLLFLFSINSLFFRLGIHYSLLNNTRPRLSNFSIYFYSFHIGICFLQLSKFFNKFSINVLIFSHDINFALLFINFALT